MHLIFEGPFTMYVKWTSILFAVINSNLLTVNDAIRKKNWHLLTTLYRDPI